MEGSLVGLETETLGLRDSSGHSKHPNFKLFVVLHFYYSHHYFPPKRPQAPPLFPKCGVNKHWWWPAESEKSLAHRTSRTCMALCSFQGQRDLSEGPKLAWGSGCPGLCARPFSSTSGPRKTDRRKQQHPSPSPYSSSICTAELDGPARMWRAPLLKLFLVSICCVRWCHSEGK